MKLLPLPLPPLLSRLPRLPRPPRLSSALLGATVLELAVLAGHLAVYPFGLTPERRPPTRPTGTEPGSGGATALPATAVAAPPPVVLLHGFVDNRSVFLLLRRALIRNGHDHGHHRHLESLNYSPLTRDIRAAAGLLGRHVEEICARTGHHRVDIVGHSLGGLIARYYVQRLGGDRRVRTLVTLGTPHGGTAVAPGAGIHPIVRQMRAGSSVIEELRAPAPGCRTRFVSFWSELDQVMVPAETACVDHPDLDAVNVRVTGIGHLALPVHPTVAAAIREALDAPVTGEDAAPADGTASVA
ncbi:alpha/beta fold hydrolase [Streptomyces sp. ATCC51928]|uniref:Lipase family alpha/beta hydrolase n=1 Tax=Streptomyces caviscabies TaxID=90079 RepID=A0ABW2MDW7_9ACTN|nr:MULTISPECIES: alpha/beta fold hydrolase [unclassified Streptomyces]MDX3504174.1 alpha/beta fold hydrolase [Streptomyces sp. ATCC51928]MDX5519326.1 alpha/beta fold hydrolase [Streptomyces sp. DE06-01C]